MVKEIKLQDLVEKVRHDLFSPYMGTDKEGKIVYPLFFVEKVELELAIELSYEGEYGLKVIIPQIIEGSLTDGQGKINTNTMKVTLVPILTIEEQRKLIEGDERLIKGIQTATMLSLRKGTGLAGEEE